MGFRHVQWITTHDKNEAPLFRRHFQGDTVTRAELLVCGLGFFEAWLNGKPVSEDVFSPALSTYSQLNGRKLTYPLHDIFASPRVYYCRYDVTQLMRHGENTLCIALGNGWYNQHERNAEGDWAWNCPRLLYEVQLTFSDGRQTFVSSAEPTCAAGSHILRNNLFYGEIQNLALKEDWHLPNYDDSRWEQALLCDGPEGELTEQTCPPDRIVRCIQPQLIGSYNGKLLYDVGENISGFIRFSTRFSGTIELEYAEEVADGELDPASAGSRVTDVFYGDGRQHVDVHPQFSWHGFRYFTVTGEISEPVCCVVHTILPRTSSFHSDSPVLNWLDDAYCRTQQMNVHGSVPLDCPHRERLGYTGDGQLCAQSCMTMFDSRAVYEKWMQDILDCQDIHGHVQHTAPFLGGGGGPAGWGGAIVVVPYVYYWQYGDTQALRHWYPGIRRYFAYMEAHCRNGLVVSEEEGGWCLGDWVIPDTDAMSFSPEFVNTCLLVKYYGYLQGIETALGVPSSIDTRALQGHLHAIRAYEWADGNYLHNLHAANAFAGDIGLLSSEGLENLVEYYRSENCLDTGIFGTEILLRFLFEKGYDDLAIQLLTSEKQGHSFGCMMGCGATTLWEGFSGEGSHSHPMNGACVKLLYQYILGIRPLQPGYRQFVVSPTSSGLLRHFQGHITTPMGQIQVSLRRENRTRITVTIFPGANGKLCYGGRTEQLQDGENQFEFDD